MRVVLPLLLLVACSEPRVAVYDAPKEYSGLAWDAPKAWKEKPADAMRRAIYAAGAAEFTVVSLPGEAGGALANVNRWRGQLGLGPVEKVDGRSVKTPAGEATLVEFEHKGKRTAAAFLMVEGESWFFKLTGPASSVRKERAGLLSLLGSLRRA